METITFERDGIKKSYKIEWTSNGYYSPDFGSMPNAFLDYFRADFYKHYNNMKKKVPKQ